MPFNREPNYNNRYLPSDRFFEWRNLPGEVPQAAELNEIQSLVKDLVQRTGDSILQNGDIISGMLVLSAGTVTDPEWNIPVTRYNVEAGGQIWIDGVVHDVPGNVTGLPVPAKDSTNNPLWGFIGVYLQKEVIKAEDNNTLYDPAIQDAQGNFLGLPGANRTKVTPVWVAGTLPVSEFDDKSISTFRVITNSQQSSAKLTIDVDTVQTISTNCLYNAKISFPSVYNNDTTISNLKIYNNDLKVVRPDSQIKCSIKVSGANNNNIKAYMQLFINGIACLPEPANKTTITNNTATQLSLTVTSGMLSAVTLKQSNGNPITSFNVGLVIESTSGYINHQAIVYVSDVHVLNSGESRKPVYKSFKTATGSTYNNFMVGPGGFIKHGNTGNSPAGNTVRVSDLSQIASLQSLDRIIRDTELTEADDQEFISTYGVSAEEALLRIYPVHITYDGNIVSSLPNREFSRLVDRLLSERLGKVLSSSVVEGLELEYITNQTTKVRVNSGNAFINGRLFTGAVGQTLTLPAATSGSGTQALVNPQVIGFDRSGYVKASEAYKINSGNFTAINDIRVVALFKETVTHKSHPEYSERPFLPDLSIPLADLDVLDMFAVQVYKVIDATGKVYTRGLDWDVITRVKEVSAGNFKPVSIIGWHTFDATDSIPASSAPTNNATYDVYYSVELPLTLPSGGSTESVHLKYFEDTASNYSSFDLKTVSADLDNVSGTKLASYTNSNNNVNGPFLKISNTAVNFIGQIQVYSYNVGVQNSYIVYLSGNVSKDGPDGVLGYQVIGGSTDSAGNPVNEQNAKEALLRDLKLPLGRVTVPITSASNVVNYQVKSISLATQQSVNDSIDDLLELVPALINQNLLAGDTTASRTYETSTVGSDYKRLKTVNWSVDANAFPMLAGYKSNLTYSYFGENPDLRDNVEYANYLGQSLAANEGLLRGIIIELKDSSDALIKKIIVTFSYDPATLDLLETETEVL